MQRLVEALNWKARVEAPICPNLRIYSLPAGVLGEEEKGCSLEERFLALLKEGGAWGIHAENDFWVLVWTFLYWDVIFQKTAEGYDERFGASFPSEKHDIPRDLFRSGSFFASRQDSFEARRNELSAKGLPEEFRRAFSKHSKAPTRLLEALPKFSPADLQMGLELLPTEAALRVLDRLAWDFNSNRSGLPDLLVRTDRPQIFELKGPSDSTRQNQIDWLRYLGGRCGLEAGVITVGWSDKKTMNLNSKLDGPAGSLTVSYGKSGSKYFKEVEETVDTWPEVKRDGSGQSLSVEATLPLARIAEAAQVLGRISRWKDASVQVDGKGQEIGSGSPLRCLAEKESQYEGKDFCQRDYYGGSSFKDFGCRLFHHQALLQNDFSEHGYRDSEKGVYVLDKEKLRSEVEAQAADLEVCPHFDRKRVLRLVEKLPAQVNPKTDKKWAWVDGNGNDWIFEQGKWTDSYGTGDFPGVGQMVRVSPVDSQTRAYILRGAREFSALSDYTHTVRVGTSRSVGGGTSRTYRQKSSGCAVLVAALSGLSLVLFLALIQ